MIIAPTVKQLSTVLEHAKQNSQVVGFVPTMGALHQGHASLIQQAKLQCDFVVCSIFVNPTQFNNQADLVNYPKTEKQDQQLLSKTGCDLLFMPSTEAIYPNNYFGKTFNFGSLETVMEGKHRPGHFAGVAAVVNRLFDIITPDFAFFGEKDYQQLLIVKELAKNNHPNTKIVPVPIVREKDGLAMSSRNLRLSEPFRKESTILYHTLLQCKNWLGKHSIKTIKEKVVDIFEDSNLELEYFEIANANTLNILSDKDEKANCRAFIAAYAGKIRLIDNISLS